MMVQLDTANPRSLRGVTLAAQAASWLNLILADGRTAFGIPSSRDPLKYYITTENGCSCPDTTYGNGRACKHSFAVRLFKILREVVA